MADQAPYDHGVGWTGDMNEVVLELRSNSGWETVGSVSDVEPPGSLSAHHPQGREIYLFGWYQGVAGVWRSQFGADIETSAFREIATAIHHQPWRERTPQPTCGERNMQHNQNMSNTGELRLRPLQPCDEHAARCAHEQMQDDHFDFLLSGYTPDTDWATHLATIDNEHHARNLPVGRIRATFLGAFVNGTLIGRASIRYSLTPHLYRIGGHIGYGVIATARRQGHAQEILRHSLIIARANGVQPVLVTCDDTNIGSATVIERCGATPAGTIMSDNGIIVRRYWID